VKQHRSEPARRFGIPGTMALKSRAAQKMQEGCIVSLFSTLTIWTVLLTILITVVLGVETWIFFRNDQVSIVEFFTSAQWSPLLGSKKHFGIWPLICGTFLVSAIALSIAVPFGLISALYLSEYAHSRVRSVLKPTLEILAGIPTVVYGFFALTVITPGLKLISNSFGSYNAMSAGIAVGILILPTVASLSEDAFRAVPDSLREGALGLGATKYDVSVKIVFPAAFSGVVSSILLAAARAIGETMIVALAAGSMPRVTLDVTKEIQTMTGFMVQMALGDVSNYGVEYLSMYAVAFILFVCTLLFTVVGALIRKRFREVYE
jgi:phosphate transport system permease protein